MEEKASVKVEGLGMDEQKVVGGLKEKLENICDPVKEEEVDFDCKPERLNVKVTDLTHKLKLGEASIEEKIEKLKTDFNEDKAARVIQHATMDHLRSKQKQKQEEKKIEDDATKKMEELQRLVGL